MIEVPILYKVRRNVVHYAKVDDENAFLLQYQWWLSETRKPAPPRTRLQWASPSGVRTAYVLMNRLVALLSYEKPEDRARLLATEPETIVSRLEMFPRCVLKPMYSDPFDCRVECWTWVHSERSQQERERRRSMTPPVSAFQLPTPSPMPLQLPTRRPSGSDEPKTGFAEDEVLETPEQMLEIVRKLRSTLGEEGSTSIHDSRSPVVLETNRDALAYVATLFGRGSTSSDNTE